MLTLADWNILRYMKTAGFEISMRMYRRILATFFNNGSIVSHGDYLMGEKTIILAILKISNFTVLPIYNIIL